MLGNVACFCCGLLTFSKNYFWDTIRVSNSLYPDQHRQNVGPDLGLKQFAKVISRRQKSWLGRQDLKGIRQYSQFRMLPLTLEATITTATDDKFCDLFPNLKKKK